MSVVRALHTAALMTLSFGVLPGCGFDSLTRSDELRPSPQDCGGCHVAIYQEWSDSAHAGAFRAAEFQQVTAGAAIDSCLPCHAPAQVYGTEPLAARGVDRAYGVDCVSCHLSGGALVGPLPSAGLVSPHPVRAQDPLYLKSDLCGRCHQYELREWRTAPQRDSDGLAKRTCQQCHMKVEWRTITQATDTLSSVIVATETNIAQRRHRFSVDAVDDPQGAADVALTPSAEGLEVRVSNRLPHGLPTGGYGSRRVELRLTFRAEDGSDVGAETLVWSVRHGTSIPPSGEDVRSVAVPARATFVVAALVRPARGTRPLLVLKQTRASLR